ncbi:MAG TPA: recombinase family protein, partial [Armatimonadota bacterium]|nr:recombinase family protein [Armatimonadota bacterium]
GKESELTYLSESTGITTATGKLLIHIIAAFAQFERDNMTEDTKAGLDAAKPEKRTGVAGDIFAMHIAIMISDRLNHGERPRVLVAGR